MTISATNAHCDDDTLHVALADGRTLGVPLAWFPRLLNGTEKARANIEITPFGLHWPDLDEDLSIAGLLSGEHPAIAAE